VSTKASGNEVTCPPPLAMPSTRRRRLPLSCTTTLKIPVRGRAAETPGPGHEGARAMGGRGAKKPFVPKADSVCTRASAQRGCFERGRHSKAKPGGVLWPISKPPLGVTGVSHAAGIDGQSPAPPRPPPCTKQKRRR
jgi:hypothetical protein